jgi:hypothetical protein
MLYSLETYFIYTSGTDFLLEAEQAQALVQMEGLDTLVKFN